MYIYKYKYNGSVNSAHIYGKLANENLSKYLHYLAFLPFC